MTNVYTKDVSKLSTIDVYRVLDLYKVTHPAIQHAIKKLLCAGERGVKDQLQDIEEAMQALQRWKDMEWEDDVASQPEQVGAVAEDDPHAELRKTWKPHQIWQVDLGNEDWRDLIGPFGKRLHPIFQPNLNYRRHPDDKDPS